MDSGHVASAQFGTTTFKTGHTITLTSLTQAAGTATATKVGHGFRTGDTITHAGANQAGYNIAAAITVVDADSYTFAVDPGTVSPATGTVTATGADQAVSDSTTIVADTQLFAPIGAGESWEYEWVLVYSNTDDTTDSMDIKVAAPSGATGYYWTLSPEVKATPAIALGTEVTVAANSLDATKQVRTVKAIVHNGATAGNVALGFAQTTGAGATQAAIYAGSVLKASQLFGSLVV